MIDINILIFVSLLGIIFVIGVKEAWKNYDKSKLNWKKIFRNFWLISFSFLASILLFGLFGTKQNPLIFVVIILLIIPGLFFTISLWLMPKLVTIFHKDHKLTKEGVILIHCLVFNRVYLLIVFSSIFYWIIHKIF